MYLRPALEAAHKILEAYADRVEAVTLKPGHDGVFRVTAHNILIIQMGDEGLPNAERVAHAVGEFLNERHLPGTERGAPPSTLGKGAGGLGQGPGERSP